jgi:CHAD domain-containing protein
MEAARRGGEVARAARNLMGKGAKIGWKPRGSVAANARKLLPGVAAAYFAEARTLLEQVSDPAGLHRLRLISKRLRYTLELFRRCYPGELDERIDALKRVQDLLGEINDAVVTAGLIGRGAGSVRMQRYLEELAAEKAAAFRSEWTERFDASGAEAWWTDFLSSAARVGSRR